MYALASTIQFYDQDQERELVYAAQGGDIKARNQLLVSLLPMVVRLVARMVGARHPHFEDYIQEGVLGNIVGIDKFDLDSFGNRYYSYGYWWIRHFIDNEHKADQLWSNTVAVDLGKFTVDDAFNIVNLDSPPEIPLDSDTFHGYIVDDLNFSPIVAPDDLFEQFRIGGLTCHHDLLTEMLDLVDGNINAKQRRVLRLYYHEGWTFKAIGTEMGYSQRWIMELRNRALVKLKNKVDQLSV